MTAKPSSWPGLRRRRLAWLLVLACPCDALAADLPNAVHGHSDLFAAQGVVIAWGVLRGGTEQETTIVVRVLADASRYAQIAVDGVDPFTQQRRSLVALRPLAGSFEVRTPRAHFADFPRTEFGFHATGSAPAAAQATLLVFYLGVPDTTPEFTNQAGLDAYLADRVSRASR